MPDTPPADAGFLPPAEPRLRVVLFEHGHDAREIASAELDRHARPSEHQLLWVDVLAEDGPPECLGVLGVDLDSLEPEKGGELGLIVDDGWKLLFVRALDWQGSVRPAAIPLTFALGPNILVTLRRERVGFVDGVLDNEADHLRVGRLESTVFAMALLDRMLTDYLDARDAFETSLDRLELMILREPHSSHLLELQALRHLASKMRRHLAAQRDLFDAMARPDFDPEQSDDARRACRLISGRYSRVMTSIENARELVNGSLDLYTSRTAESTNQAMHTLTVVTVAMGLAATIAAVLGMNFDAPIFHSGARGFIAALVGIGLIVGASVAWALLRLRSSSRRATSPS